MSNDKMPIFQKIQGEMERYQETIMCTKTSKRPIRHTPYTKNN